MMMMMMRKRNGYSYILGYTGYMPITYQGSVIKYID